MKKRYGGLTDCDKQAYERLQDELDKKAGAVEWLATVHGQRHPP